MFKLTVYRKVRISRNFSLLILVVLLLLVSAKIYLAHEKITVYNEGVKLFKSGNLVEAEEKFRNAKLNVSVADHNTDINYMLSILSPIREIMEDIDEKAANYYEDGDLDQLVDLYKRWQNNQKKWVSGTSVQKDMYGEMAELTMLDRDMKGYFSDIKNGNLEKLVNQSVASTSEEEEIFSILNKIPVEYFGKDESVKTKKIETSFQNYYGAKIKNQISNGSLAAIIDEGNRQFSTLRLLAMDADWLVDILDSHLLAFITAAYNKKDYAAFADSANTIKKLEGNMKDATVFSSIKKSTADLFTEAENLINTHKYKDAISIYEAIRPLEDTTELIAEANLSWDKYEPIRVLERLYPGKEFSAFVNQRNQWGADSVVAAVSKDGGLYFGRLSGEEAMVVTEGTIEDLPVINKLSFQTSLGTSDNPVLYIDAKSPVRKHQYLAYEVRSGSMVNILDVEADKLTVESREVLAATNPAGEGEGEIAYFEPDANGKYQFAEIKVDYVDIEVKNIGDYFGEKVRFTAYADTLQKGGALVTLTETYNDSTGLWEKTYVLLKGEKEFIIYQNYTVIGIFDSYEEMTDENGETVRVPVFQVEKVE